MKKIATLSAISLLCLPLLVGCAITPVGPSVSQDRAIEDVSEVSLVSYGDLVITRGEPSLTITAAPNVIDSLTAEVRDGVLYLDAKPGLMVLRGNVKYELSLPTVQAILIDGAGDVTADFAGAANVSIAIDGSGDIEGVNIDAKSVTVTVAGAGNVELSGASDRGDVSIGGSGDVDLDNLIVRDAMVSIDGAGDIRVHATGTLNASISGSGTIRHSGGAKVTSQIDGLGDIVAD